MGYLKNFHVNLGKNIIPNSNNLSKSLGNSKMLMKIKIMGRSDLDNTTSVETRWPIANSNDNNI